MDIPIALPISEADPKPWWQSRAIWGALAVIISQVLAMVGVSLDAPAITEILFQAAGLVGGILALVGRIGAQQPIRPPV